MAVLSSLNDARYFLAPHQRASVPPVGPVTEASHRMHFFHRHRQDPREDDYHRLLGPIGHIPPAEFEEALFALSLNQISEPVETDAGLHLITATEITRAEKPAFEDRKPALEQRLQLKILLPCSRVVPTPAPGSRVMSFWNINMRFNRALLK